MIATQDIAGVCFAAPHLDFEQRFAADFGLPLTGTAFGTLWGGFVN